MSTRDQLQCRSEPVSSTFKTNIMRGKVAFVTGGATGIGLRISEAFLRHGARVAIGSRRIDIVEAAKLNLEEATGGSVLACRLDVRSAESVNNAVSITLAQWDRIDVLVNAAAGNFLASAETLTPNAFKTVMDIDANGTFLMSQQVFVQCMKRTGGVIINITATLHYNGELLQVHAGSAKAAIQGMTRHLANEWGRYGVRVNNIAPGPIADTVGFEKLAGKFGDCLSKQLTRRVALRRLGRTDEIASVALFLASDASSLITGSTIDADGGSWFFGGGLVAEYAMKLQQQKDESPISRL